MMRKGKVRQILQSLLLAFLISSSCLFARDKNKDPGPNVLFIAVDDLKPTIGCFGDSLANTPGIDALARQATIMSSNYCQQAVCAPSRISLFTGMRPHYTGVTDLKTFMRDVNPEILTLPEYFKSMGYQTAGLGKLMHGARKNDPGSWSIPYRENHLLEYAAGYGYPANGKYQSAASQEAYAEARKKGLNWKQTNDLLKTRGLHPPMEFLDVPDKAYTDGAIAAEGIRLLQEFSDSGAPFFLALGFQKPHLPFAAPLKYYELYEETEFSMDDHPERAVGSPEYAYSNWPELRGYTGIPKNGPIPETQQIELIRGYYASVSYVDAQIHRVCGKLRELGLYENTVIILWGDHGWHLGDHGLWCKHSNFEQATHSPLLISAPGYRKAQKSASLTEFVDVFPTLCALCGLKVPGHLQGKSLVGLLENPGEEVKEFAVSQFPRGKNIMGYSLRSKNYRYTSWYRGYYGKDGRFIPEAVEAEELYDYARDPYETENFISEPAYSELCSVLAGKMESFLAERLTKK